MSRVRCAALERDRDPEARMAGSPPVGAQKYVLVYEFLTIS